jgi:hypothetical protein
MGMIFLFSSKSSALNASQIVIFSSIHSHRFLFAFGVIFVIAKIKIPNKL